MTEDNVLFFINIFLNGSFYRRCPFKYGNGYFSIPDLITSNGSSYVCTDIIKDYFERMEDKRDPVSISFTSGEIEVTENITFEDLFNKITDWKYSQ